MHKMQKITSYMKKKWTNMNEKIARYGVQYASSKLGLSEIEVMFKSQSFFKFTDVNAMLIKEQYLIIFNKDWIAIAHEFEILKCSFHETRHAYQVACIDFPELIEHDPKEVDGWKKEYSMYTRPGSPNYSKQKLEIDAFRYSNYLLKIFLKEFMV